MAPVAVPMTAPVAPVAPAAVAAPVPPAVIPAFESPFAVLAREDAALAAPQAVAQPVAPEVAPLAPLAPLIEETAVEGAAVAEQVNPLPPSTIEPLPAFVLPHGINAPGLQPMPVSEVASYEPEPLPPAPVTAPVAPLPVAVASTVEPVAPAAITVAVEPSLRLWQPLFRRLPLR